MQQWIYAIVLSLACTTVAAKDLAVVNKKTITDNDYDAFAKMHNTQPFQKAGNHERMAVLRAIINRELLYQQALKKKLDQNIDKNMGPENKRSMLANLMVRELTSADEFSFENLKKNYKNSTVDYRISHILVKSKKSANSVLSQLKKGKSFAALAKSKSMDMFADQGGDLGWVSKESLPASLYPALTTKPGDYYRKPLSSDYGWHVIKIEKTRKVPQPPFEQVKQQLQQDKIREFFQNYMRKLQEDSKIEVKL